MRVLVISPGPSFSVKDVENGYTRALRALGCEVVTYNLDDRIIFFSSLEGRPFDLDQSVQLAIEPLGNLCYRWWPDIIIVISGFYIKDTLWEVWANRPHTTVLVCTESPYEDDRQLKVADKPDIVILNDPTNLDQFRALNPRSYYFPHAYDPDIHHPGPVVPELACDFAFVGTAYPSRTDLVCRVDWHDIDLKLAGNWETAGGTVLEPYVIHPLTECYDNDKAVDLYRSCKVSANFYRKEANADHLTDGWAMGPREVELAACNAFFLREPRGEGDEVFPFLPTFFGPDDFGELLRYYLDNEDERLNLASKAREAIQERTFIQGAKRLLALVDKGT